MISEKAKDLEVKQILLDAFKFADLPAYLKIQEAPGAFVDFSVKAQAQASPNLSWIDLILMFEWDLELQRIRNEEFFSKE